MTFGNKMGAVAGKRCYIDEGLLIVSDPGVHFGTFCCSLEHAVVVQGGGMDSSFEGRCYLSIA